MYYLCKSDKGCIVKKLSKKFKYIKKNKLMKYKKKEDISQKFLRNIKFKTQNPTRIQINKLHSPKFLSHKISTKLFVRKTLQLGKPRSFTHPKLLKYILGTFDSTEILNLIYSRQFLIWQVVPVIKYVCRTQLAYPVSFLLASANSALAENVKEIAISHGLAYRVGRWLSGTLTANVQLQVSPDFVIIPDCGRSAVIVDEAKLAIIPTIGLVNSNSLVASHVSHPIFGNDENLFTAQFFCQLCASLILKEQWWRNDYFINSNLVKNFRHKLNFKTIKKMAYRYWGPAWFKKQWYSKKPSKFKHQVYFLMFIKYWRRMYHTQFRWKLIGKFVKKFNSTMHIPLRKKKWTYKQLIRTRYWKVDLLRSFLWKHDPIGTIISIAKKQKKKVWFNFHPTLPIGFKFFQYFIWRTRPKFLTESKVKLFPNDFKKIYRFIITSLHIKGHKNLIALKKSGDYFAKKYFDQKLKIPKILKKKFKLRNFSKKEVQFKNSNRKKFKRRI